jgi:hypothetical protein
MQMTKFRTAVALAALMIAAPPPAPVSSAGMSCPFGDYQNSDGDCVERPDQNCDATTTAKCRDGTCSHSHHHAGTCSSHGGVKEFIK